ncbi:MAG: BON domain-containing protein [Desulfobacteraceae bacterium]|jgi:osmotically-inducible protein OsmY|nr:BON domain-containing protein [Desulfobacteraceae bacterium]
MKKMHLVIRVLAILVLIAGLAACASSPKKSSTGEFVDDSVITTKVKAKLAAEDWTSPLKISVETFKGIVQLSGFVNSKEQVEWAGNLARSVQGVRAVKNDLIVK